MMVIELWNDYSYVYDGEKNKQSKFWAVNDIGNITLMAKNKTPDPAAFNTLVTFVGLAKFDNHPISPTFGARPDPKRTGVIMYTFEQLTPEVVKTIKFGSITHQTLSPVTLDPNQPPRCWSRGIRRITFI